MRHAAGRQDERAFEVVSLHPGVSRERVVDSTGWPAAFAADVEETPVPSTHELDILRDLNERTARAHGTAAATE